MERGAQPARDPESVRQKFALQTADAALLLLEAPPAAQDAPVLFEGRQHQDTTARPAPSTRDGEQGSRWSLFQPRTG